MRELKIDVGRSDDGNNFPEDEFSPSRNRHIYKHDLKDLSYPTSTTAFHTSGAIRQEAEKVFLEKMGGKRTAAIKNAKRRSNYSPTKFAPFPSPVTAPSDSRDPVSPKKSVEASASERTTELSTPRTGVSSPTVRHHKPLFEYSVVESASSTATSPPTSPFASPTSSRVTSPVNSIASSPKRSKDFFKDFSNSVYLRQVHNASPQRHAKNSSPVRHGSPVRIGTLIRPGSPQRTRFTAVPPAVSESTTAMTGPQPKESVDDSTIETTSTTAARERHEKARSRSVERMERMRQRRTLFEKAAVQDATASRFHEHQPQQYRSRSKSGDRKKKNRQDDRNLATTVAFPNASNPTEMMSPFHRIYVTDGSDRRSASPAKSMADSVSYSRNLFSIETRSVDSASLYSRRSNASSKATRTTMGGMGGERRQMSVVYHQFGPSASVMQVEYSPELPRMKSSRDVLIKVQVRVQFHVGWVLCQKLTYSLILTPQASTVSTKDILMRRGFCFDVFHPYAVPLTPGLDIIGHVVACAPGVQGFQKGDRVAALVPNGGNSRFCTAPEQHLVKVPRRVDSAEAASMVSIYTAAFAVLQKVAEPSHPQFSLQGMKVLVIGGMDTTGQALIQMCLKAKAEVYATAPVRRHAYILNVLGALPLPEDPKEWLHLVEGDMDLVFDGLNQDGLESSERALNGQGELVLFGHASMMEETDIGCLGAPIMAHWNRFLGHRRTKKVVDLWEDFERDPEPIKVRVDYCRMALTQIQWH